MMKGNTLRLGALLLLLGALAPSCLKDQQDYFDKKPSERLSAFIEGTRSALASNDGHWRMEYFVGNVDQDRGGINLALDFYMDVDSVRIYSEETPKESYKSFYKLTTDDGPVLSFDTYNPIMHKYGTASSSYYEGRGGDYEFLVVSYTKDEIVLKGKRSGKMCRMFPREGEAGEYVQKMYDASKQFYVSTFSGTVKEQEVDGEIDVLNRQFTINAVGVDEYGQRDVKETVTVPYVLTEAGLKFYETVEFLGSSINDIDFTKEDLSFKSKEEPTLALTGFIPEDWLPYDFFPGRYVFTYDGGSIMITLVPEEEGVSFRVKGMSTQFDLIFGYDIRKGRVGVNFQAVAKPDSDEAVVVDDQYIVVLLPWELGGEGGLWMNSELGMEAVWDMKSTEKPVFKWMDNKANRTFATDSFLLYLYDTDDTAESPYAGTADKFSFQGGNYQLPYLKSLTRM